MADSAPAGAIRAGKAYFEFVAVDGALKKGIDNANRKLKSFADASNRVGKAMLAAGGVAAAAFVPAIRAASDFQETMSKFNTVFGESSAAVKAWGDEYASQVGRSKKQLADFLSSSQDLFVPMGFDAATAENLSKTITKLAIDLASFNNKSDADAMNDLQAALTGSGEVMKKYGVIVSEATVKQEALRQGWDVKKLTEVQKVQARLNIILAGTTAAQGDAIRTSDGFANQMKRLAAAGDDAKVALGNAVLPMVTELVSALADGTKTVAEFIETNEGLVRVGAAIAGVLVSVGGGLMTLSMSIYAINTALTVLNTTTGTTAMLLKGLGAVGIIAGIAAVTREIILQAKMTRELNEALEESKRLNDEIADAQAKRNQKILDEAAEIKDPEERKKFLNTHIEQETTNRDSYDRQLREAERRMLDQQALAAKVGTSEQTAEAEQAKKYGVDEARKEVDELQKKRDTVQAQIDALTEARKNVHKPTATASVGAIPDSAKAPKVNPLSQFFKSSHEKATVGLAEDYVKDVMHGFSSSAIAIRAASEKARKDHEARAEQDKADADAIREANLTPMERMQKRLSRAQELKNRKLLTDEEFGRESRMAQVEAAQAIAANQTGATEKKVAANRALELGSADAQRAIAEALAPRGDIDKQSLKALEGISKTMFDNRYDLTHFINYVKENALQLTVVGDGRAR